VTRQQVHKRLLQKLDRRLEALAQEITQRRRRCGVARVGDPMEQAMLDRYTELVCQSDQVHRRT